MKLTPLFIAFFDSEKSAAAVLALCTLCALALANSPVGTDVEAAWQVQVLGFSLEHWVNDALMAVFFLLIGLELEREIYVGELSAPRKAILPLVAALGGIVVPAGIHFAFNAGTPYQAGAGIPMATDIAFALGALALLAGRIPPALKVFLVALAVTDDLGAILVIAIFYSSQFSAPHLLGALAVFAALLLLNLRWRVMALTPYLLGGCLMWYLTYRSGLHATLAGVALAFAIPFRAPAGGLSPSHRLEQALHKPVAFVVLPLFALANTGITIGADWLAGLGSTNSLGILLGLGLGKALGIAGFSWLAVRSGLALLPEDSGWRHVIGVGFLGGIGFTMSIFITNLAFAGQAELINASKMAILIASLCAGSLGLAWLSRCAPAAQREPQPK